jgi:hypothetical protein
MAGLDPAIPLRLAPCIPKRDHRDKPGDDEKMLGCRAGMRHRPSLFGRRGRARYRSSRKACPRAGGERDLPHFARSEGDGAPQGASSQRPRLSTQRALCESAHALRRSIAAFLDAGPRFRRGIPAPAVSELLAGVPSDPGRCPGAARVCAYEAHPQAPHPAPSSERLRTTSLR